jgi:hypothetical protein
MARVSAQETPPWRKVKAARCLEWKPPTMTEIDPEATFKIYDRAAGKCECENPKCSHPAIQCTRALDAKSDIVMPDGTPRAQQFEKGRAVCEECYQRSDTIIDKWKATLA